MLDPEVTLRVDAGPDSPLAREPIVGAEEVLAEAKRFSALAPYSRPAIVNGTAGVVVGSGARPVAVAGFAVLHDRIIAIDLITDPDKLSGLVFVG